ncbi:hypothetical protein GCM10008097_27600 [Mycetocola manganoxydans]|nr:hypothetical protein GCM10008097_27600 [Mycetocola manganoxydans]
MGWLFSDEGEQFFDYSTRAGSGESGKSVLLLGGGYVLQALTTSGQRDGATAGLVTIARSSKDRGHLVGGLLGRANQLGLVRRSRLDDFRMGSKPE